MLETPGDLAAWLDFISVQHSKEIELGLERIRLVAERLKLRPFNCPLITVAGTNGKGSSVTALERIYTAAGYRTGCYTSPHLTTFNERIRLQRDFATDDMICEAFNRINTVRDEIPLTYFEFSTLAAFIIFQKFEPDVVLLEVGLGGRLDATNLYSADIALITSIGIDHADWLGSDRETIAVEKAGIIHPGKSVVIADPDPPESLLKIAHDKAGAVIQLNKDFHYDTMKSAWNWQWNKKMLQAMPLPGLHGRAQLNNIAGVIMCVTALQGDLPIDDKTLHETLPELALAGRFQVVEGTPLLVLDVAHNPDSTALLAENLREQDCAGETCAVVAMLKDKDIATSLSNIRTEIDRWYVAGLTVARGENANNIREIIQKIDPGKSVHEFTTVEEAWQQAVNQSSSTDRVVVFGSFHTVGAIISHLAQTR